MVRTLQERMTRELKEAIDVCENYRSVDRASGEVVVYDSERGAPTTGNGTPLPGADTSITRDAEN